MSAANDDCHEYLPIGRDTDAICCLPPGHSGPHWDDVEGWEW